MMAAMEEDWGEYEDDPFVMGLIRHAQQGVRVRPRELTVDRGYLDVTSFGTETEYLVGSTTYHLVLDDTSGVELDTEIGPDMVSTIRIREKR